MIRNILIALVAIALLSQLVPIDRSNPPATQVVTAPAEVRAVLEESCYDCHSYNTRWPWYGYVAPVSWMLAYTISEARGKMNLSTWDAYTPKKQADHLEEIWEEVDEGNMPKFPYLWMHADAVLTEADKELLENWADPAL